ncbi:MAG: type IV toxin-antitoxin system AbiEi family antitoxin domain-containing protein [Actinomycetota bacterium]|nr:type IV toxin-antitoxin system AbiEi family antitoxin domain-containing protein [Actinomycetota bacterium]
MLHARGFAHLPCGQIHLRARGLGHDEAVARLAAVQHGVVSRSQLLSLGLSARMIDHRLAVGRLRRVHRGVYAVGHDVLAFEARVLAALLATEPGSVASHRTAAALAGADVSTEGPIHVTTQASRRPQAGIVLHRGLLRADEVTLFAEEIPATKMARTFLDLSGTERPLVLRRLVKQAESDGRVSFDALATILARYPRRRGRRNLAALVHGIHGSSGRTRSELEDRFTEFLAERGLPAPERNVRMELPGGVIAVDCLWRDAAMVLELDGRSAHARAMAFEDDRTRDRGLLASGLRPMRATWNQLSYGADALERDLRAVLFSEAG